MRRLLRLAALAVVVAAGSLAAPRTPAVASVAATTPFATWEVPIGDIGSLGAPRTELLVKAFDPTMNAVKYLDAAQAAGQKVVVVFTDTVDYGNGTIRPSKIAAEVAKVRGHPALYGYLSVKEPSWSGIGLSEMRTLYQAYRKADPSHPVVALLGDIPHFGTSANPWASGVADVLWVDWYPVTYSRGYIATASTNFPKVRAYVDAHTPGTPIWLMVQGHGYKAGDRRTPTAAELEREVRDGLTYLHADGIVFYTWHNAQYDKDLQRNPALWSTARSIVSRVRAGTFLPPTADPTVAGFDRLSGSDRYGTAAAISAATFPTPGVPVAYVATGANFPDALAGSVAAARAGGPLLLVSSTTVPAATAAELRRLAPGRIVVLGGPSVVSFSVSAALAAFL